VATFVSTNGSGAVALVGAGVGAGILAVVGRLPTKVVISGNELHWENVLATIDNQLIVAAAENASPETLQELRELRAAMDSLKRTGRTPTASAAEYDAEVIDAIGRIQPDLSVSPWQQRSPFSADFRAELPSGALWIETKWRSDQAAPFRGRTLPSLLGGLDESDRLLVVANAADVGTAAQTVKSRLSARGRVVGWRDAFDDEDLREALNALL
jgi:hypothetical protein